MNDSKKRITLYGIKTEWPSPKYLFAIHAMRLRASRIIDYSTELMNVTRIIGKVWMEVTVA